MGMVKYLEDESFLSIVSQAALGEPAKIIYNYLRSWFFEKKKN